MFADEYFKELKKQRLRGRCLHYSDGIQCNDIASAHSIQKSGQLKLIAEDGHVYRFSADLSLLKKSGGIPLPKKLGINAVSTFDGFCRKHDNSLFSPIDTEPLTPDKQKVALYAYRCLSREYFVKENVVIAINNVISHPELDPKNKAMLDSVLTGNTLGFNRLEQHKKFYDDALSNNAFEEFEFTYFISKSPFRVQASGILSPDYDFIGRQLQDLGDFKKHLGLITFFTAPTPEGWAFGFCWHKSSNDICLPYLQSLAESCSSGGKIEDALLRLVFSCCENHAFQISWWDNLAESKRASVIDRICQMANVLYETSPEYLTKGCEGIADWIYEHVYTSLPTYG